MFVNRKLCHYEIGIILKLRKTLLFLSILYESFLYTVVSEYTVRITTVCDEKSAKKSYFGLFLQYVDKAFCYETVNENLRLLTSCM